MRDKVSQLVSLIVRDMPELTVHDITHLDALWDTASLISESVVTLSPPEGFVFGASVLLHDAALSVAAYPRGIDQIKETVEWRDAVARARTGTNRKIAASSPQDLSAHILPDVLRRLHAKQASELAKQAWTRSNGEQEYLIDDGGLRSFYGETIGEIAHSHWWSLKKVEAELSEDLGAFSTRTRDKVDRIKIASLLRVADALHIDQLRAPRFLHTLIQPTGISAIHWEFQEKLARPFVNQNSDIVYTSAQPFDRKDAEAWWLAFDTLAMVDQELRTVDLLLRTRGHKGLKAGRVKGIESPEALATTIRTRGWHPVNAQIRVSDVPQIVASLGGSNLYGDDPLVAVRELIQNAADAVQARRRIEGRPGDWGGIAVSIISQEGADWLIVEDTGIGMSEMVLTGPLLDFGTSFWKSSLVMEEFPGLVSSGMNSIGRFGIGFFSVFMLGDTVRVISKRYDKGVDAARAMEIRGGPGGRPIVWTPAPSECPIDSGTRVEVRLKTSVTSNGMLRTNTNKFKEHLPIAQIITSLAPTLNVQLSSKVEGRDVIMLDANDWINISSISLIERIGLDLGQRTHLKTTAELMRPLINVDGRIFGRAAVPSNGYRVENSGWVTVAGLRANPISNLVGVLAGEATTAARDVAVPIVPREVLSAWATEQANLLSKMKLTAAAKARAAETLLECGGGIGDLPIVRWDDKWLSSEGFRKRISHLQELIIHFDGELVYDEDKDEMHPREFGDYLTLSPNVIFVPMHEIRIVDQKGLDWPRCLFEPPERESRLADVVLEIIDECWPEGFKESEQDESVGEAEGYDVLRPVTIFERLGPESCKTGD